METRLDTLFGVILNIMFPIKMLLRVYSLCILMIDLSWVVVNAVFAVIQATYEVFRPPPMKSLSMETALVIGSGRGVGRELAIQLSELGAIVLCVDKNSANNKDTLEAIKMRDGSAMSFTCDITKKSNVEELAKQVKKRSREVLLLRNNDVILLSLTRDIGLVEDFSIWLDLARLFPALPSHDQLSQPPSQLIAFSWSEEVLAVFCQ
ncbi:hypothetical protein MSG28_010704 [Choristoneura fumiferana]|uniref:Uncharacterized protein n=1 Tax=Choristoneura fumiferana TaxID=7141 RepID=A0ACC0KP29_CHOFU|nr:hypothetical protein MSG28_010704 [Choristoneura fumiferana]